MNTALLDISSKKAQIRKTALAARKACNSKAANLAACAHLTEILASKSATAVVAGYMAIQTEIDPIETLKNLHERGFRICLPVIQGHAKPLIFREWTPDTPMIEGDFGALIPRSGDVLVPDITIIPLVGFDSKGTRLGYGGGFYDRTLSELSKTKKPFKIGFAFAGQELDSIPTDEFDQDLDLVVTEKGVTYFQTG